jgi:hypothetical protein
MSFAKQHDALYYTPHGKHYFDMSQDIAKAGTYRLAGRTVKRCS